MREVHVIPLVEVITRLLPSIDTATKRPSPYVTENHWFASEAECGVHVIPSAEVITRLFPPDAIARKKPPPKVIDFHVFVSAGIRMVHTLPLELVNTYGLLWPIDLSGVAGSTRGVLQGSGRNAIRTTDFELRYLQSNWTRFSESVKFYRYGQEVPAPWLR